jgi:hypothetical protein
MILTETEVELTDPALDHQAVITIHLALSPHKDQQDLHQIQEVGITQGLLNQVVSLQTVDRLEQKHLPHHHQVHQLLVGHHLVEEVHHHQDQHELVVIKKYVLCI